MNYQDMSKEELIKELEELKAEYAALTALYKKDTEERKIAKEELEENKEKYRGLSEAAFESIFISEKGVCIEQNQTAESIFGYTTEEAIGRYGTEWIVPEDREKVMNNMLAGYEEPYEVTALKKDGSRFPCMLKGKMMNYKGRRVRVTSLSDITDRKKVEAELIIAKEHAEESDRLKSSFLANMSHEIRTPMNGILGFAALLKEPELSGDDQQKYLSIIQKSGTRMLNIINDIVDISKIEAGLMEVNLDDTNINDQLEYICTFFSPEVEAKDMTLSYKPGLSNENAFIHTDREKIYAVLTNLVKNAIKYCDRGSIEFGYSLNKLTTDTPETLEFYVKDSGIGIAKDRQKAIFERFIQADIADTRAYQGAGLGLSISKAYVEMLGGTIGVESEEGKGSVFSFTIPYIKGNISSVIPIELIIDEEVDSRITNLKILIAEDDETSELFISTIVQHYSKQILIARDGLQAVEMCKINPDLDLILMDIKMNHMNGYDATRAIREFNKDIIIIAQTAHGLAKDREKAIAAGCNDYIPKPLNINKLKWLINQYFSD